MTNTAFTAPPLVERIQKRALVVGGIGFLMLLAGALLSPAQFFHSYLIGYLFWTGISVGCLALLMLQHLTGGGWGLVIRRVLEAGTRVLALMAILFIPILLGARQIYPWTANVKFPEAVQDKVDHFLNRPFFTLRAAIYLAIWLLLAFYLNKWSRAQDGAANTKLARNMRMLSGPGMVLFVFTVTFAAIDWSMSLDPAWSSTIYGLLFVAAWGLSALAFVIAALAVLSKYPPMSEVVAHLHFHDLGKLLLALVMLWAYFAFSQYLIIWSGNLPEEIQWYMPRIRGGWGALALVVIVLHFALPFLFLLSRSLKRNPHQLVLVAGLILIMRYLDLIWLVEPNFAGGKFHRSLILDLVAPFAFGGIWLAAFAWQLRQLPLMPINDPEFPVVLEQVREDHHEEDFAEETGQ